MRPVAIRASSLGELFDCPTRWEAKHILKKRMPASSAAALGTAVHAGAAVFDQSKLDGNPLTPDEAAGAVVDAIFHTEEDIDWSEQSQSETEKIAVPLHRLYCEKIAPQQQYAAVETTCENLEVTDIGLVLTGTVDRVRRTDGGRDIADIKTGKTAVAADGTVKTQGHAAQIGVYELLASHALGKPMTAPAQIIGLNAAKMPAGRRAGIGEVKNPAAILLDDEEDRPGLLRLAAKIIHSGDFYGNAKSMTCHEKYCPIFKTCRWRR